MIQDYALLLEDFKSLFSFIAFFLVIFVFGKCMLDTMRSLWGWIVVSIALLILVSPSSDFEISQRIQGKMLK